MLFLEIEKAEERRDDRTHSFLQDAALLGQFDGMNVSEGGVITQHLTVHGSHHDLLHLLL